MRELRDVQVTNNNREHMFGFSTSLLNNIFRSIMLSKYKKKYSLLGVDDGYVCYLLAGYANLQIVPGPVYC